MKGRRFYLSITSWIGIGIGATHYYGAIQDAESKRVTLNGRDELTRPLTTKEAKQWNEKDKTSIWRKGVQTSRFKDKLAVIVAAKQWFAKHAKEGDVLIEGSPAYAYASKKVIARKPRKGATR